MLLRKKEEIEAWLNQYQIKNYELIEDQEYGYIVNVNGGVNLNLKKLKSIDVKFNEVRGFFDCENNKLKSLEGCPEIVEGYFDVGFNKVEVLEYSPKLIKGGFYCNNNNLKSLKSSNEIVVEYDFDCSNNQLLSLNGSPEIVNGSFYIQNNNLSIDELIYLPKSVSKKIYIYSNQKLGDLQQIDDFNELKEKVDEIFKIKEEKENLLNNNVVNKI